MNVSGAYDAAGRLGTYANAEGGALELQYDDAGQIVRRTSWRDATTASVQCYTYYAAYDANAGKLQSVEDPRSDDACGPSPSASAKPP